MIRVFMLAKQGLLPSQQPTIDMAPIRQLAASVAELASLVVPICAQVDRLRAEVADLKAAAANKEEGMIQSQQDTLLANEVKALAETLVHLGDYPSMRSAVPAINQQVMAIVEWGGTGRARKMMPAGRFAAARAAIRAMQHQANRRLRSPGMPRQTTIWSLPVAAMNLNAAPRKAN